VARIGRLTLIGGGAAVVLGLATATAPALASPVSLVLPQGAAFSVLGHSCGGIQEKAYATGFDQTSGYPVGEVNLSTSCGGSGRGGGYHSTTYTAWVAVTWDFTGALVSYQAPGSANVNPTFSASDQHGNQIYNQSNYAYLALGPGFVPAPRFVALSSSIGPANGGTSVTITGTGFTGATAVSFGGTKAASFAVNGDTSITAVSPSAAAGTVDVTVTSAGGTSSISASDQFTFVAAPSVTGLSPAQGSVSGGASVTITGANLAAATAVYFGGTGTWWTVNADGSITASAPPGEAVDTVDVTVTSVGGTSAHSAADVFTYTPAPPPPPVPVVTGLAPSSGSVDGGDSVTISGSGFTGATGVSFGGIDAASFTVNDDGSITAMSPPGSAGTVDVTVTTPGGGPSAAVAGDQFTYVDPPPVTTTTTTTTPPPPSTTTTTTTTATPPPPTTTSLRPVPKTSTGAKRRSHHHGRRHRRRRKTVRKARR
jgi:IPT/TIG domain